MRICVYVRSLPAALPQVGTCWPSLTRVVTDGDRSARVTINLAQLLANLMFDHTPVIRLPQLNTEEKVRTNNHLYILPILLHR